LNVDSFTKTGASTWTLTGPSTYTGSTAVNAGTLLVNGSLANTAVSVASNATLGGSGSIAGLTTFNSGAHLDPGNSPGTLTFTGGLTLTGGSILDFELGSTSDLIRVSGGTLSGPLSGLVTLNLSNSGGFTAGTYTLFDFTSAATSSFDIGDFTFGTTLPGYTYALAFAGSTLALTATASAIPEPSTYAALAGALVLGLALYRRRRP
ncbi:MAG: autotransporter, partial [Verrucomicrobiales bacterium VVV1]